MNIIALVKNWIAYSPEVARMFASHGAKDGVATAILFSWLMNRWDWERDAGRLVGGHWMVLTTGYIQEQTGLSRRAVENAREALELIGFFQARNLGAPPKLHWRAVPDVENLFATSYKLACQMWQINLPDVATSNIVSNIGSNITHTQEAADVANVASGVRASVTPPPPVAPAPPDHMEVRRVAKEKILQFLADFPAMKMDWEDRHSLTPNWAGWESLVADMCDRYCEEKPIEMRQNPEKVFRKHVSAWLKFAGSRKSGSQATATKAPKTRVENYKYETPSEGF
jgi:hypothetical protein